MAILLIAKADPLMPAYNPIKFIYASTNSGNPGFKFVFDIYESGTANKIAEYRVLPQYVSGYGEIDLSKLLQAKVSYDLELANTTVYDAPGSHYKYDVAIGEEYLTMVQYFASLTNNAGNVQINVANSFVVGDQINISQSDGGVANPNLEGLQTVIGVGPGYLVVNSPWSLVTDATINGDITYADGRRTINRALRQDKNNYVFNGAIRWIEWPAYDYQDYLLNNVTDKLLTTLPTDGYYATLAQDLWMDAVNNSPAGSHRMVFENNLGDILDKNVAATDHVVGISVGPNNHGATNVVAGSAPLIKPGTEWYDFYYEHLGTQTSQKYRIYLDRRVRDIEYHILFLDRMGSWGSFAFTGRYYEKGNVTREQFNRDVQGYITGNEWTYNTQDKGYVNSYISTDTTIDLNTNWMTEEMAQYFSELISSPETYIKKAIYDDEDCELPQSTEYISCNILTSSYELFKKRNKNLIRQSITIKYANNDMVNG